MLNNILTSLIASSGLFCGVFLAFIAPEELKDGKKYFVILRYVLFAAFIVSAVLLLFLKNSSLLILTMSLVFLYGLPTGTLLRHKYLKKKWYFVLFVCLVPYTALVLVSNFILFIL